MVAAHDPDTADWLRVATLKFNAVRYGYASPPEALLLLTLPDGDDPHRCLSLQPGGVNAFVDGCIVVEAEDLDALEVCRPYWERPLIVGLSHQLPLPPRGRVKVWFVPDEAPFFPSV